MWKLFRATGIVLTSLLFAALLYPILSAPGSLAGTDSVITLSNPVEAAR